MIVGVEEAVACLKQGGMIIIVDDETRENEGDLVVAAECATPEAINFMATHGRGLICVAMAGHLLDRLKLPLMVPQARNKSGFGTAFTLSVEAAEGVSTGISAYDRAQTVQVLIDPDSGPQNIVTPGHVFPLRAREGGVLERRGQTEASVDLARLAGLTPAAVICEIMADDGRMARLPALETFAVEHDTPIVTVEAIAAYRQGADQDEGRRPARAEVSHIAQSHLPTAHGDFTVHVYADGQGAEHLALVYGQPAAHDAPLVRVHSECLTGDVLGSQRCDCGEQLEEGLRRIAQAGAGLLLYLRQEGRGIGLGNKIKAYALQDQGLDTVEANHQLGFPADARQYGVAAAMLADRGVAGIRLLTNNPAKIESLQESGIEVIERVPHVMPAHESNAHYLDTKAKKMGHLLIDGP